MVKMQEIGEYAKVRAVTDLADGVCSKFSEIEEKISALDAFSIAFNDKFEALEEEVKERLSPLENLVKSCALLERKNLWLTQKFYNMITPISILRGYYFELERTPWYKKLFKFQRKKIYKKVEQQLTAYWGPQEENAYKSYREFDKWEYFLTLGYTEEQVDKYLVGKKTKSGSNISEFGD